MVLEKATNRRQHMYGVGRVLDALGKSQAKAYIFMCVFLVSTNMCSGRTQNEKEIYVLRTDRPSMYK